MAKPLTFGVELEFLVAHVSTNGKEPEPALGKVVRFPINPEDKTSEKPESRSVYRHIVSTLQNAGFTSALKENRGAGDYTLWGVKGDSTVEPPIGSQWDWVDVEVVSPILALTEENLEAVRTVCKLIRDTYKYEVPKSSALHVHIGDGDSNFTFETIQKLILFLWTFEPQLNTIHPPWRIDIGYANSIRNKSGFAEEWICKYGERPSPLQGLIALRKYKTMEEICDAASYEIAKFGAYNFRGVKAIAGGKKIGSLAFAKPTVEFRQHTGTLDGEATTTWIKAVGGIMDFAKNASPDIMNTLLSGTKYETWERFGNSDDAKKEQEFGFTLAEGPFTAVDLFRYIGLNDCADYYEDKMYDHTFSASVPRDGVEVYIEDKDGKDTKVMAKDLPKFLRTWDFEKDTQLEHGSAAYADLQSKKELWEAWKRLDNFLKAEGGDGITIDLDSDFWPSGKMTTIKPDPPPLDFTLP